jgi:ketosteroid isomerase-like protein
MRKEFWAGALVLALTTAALASATQAQPDRSADRRAIVAGERAWGAAYVTGDRAAVERLLADDFRGVAPSGEAYDKAEVLREAAAAPHSTSDAVEDVTVRFYGDVAIAQAHEHTVGPPPELKPGQTVFTDTWVRRNGRWRIVAAEDLDPGTPNTPDHAADASAIRAVRAASNRAIADHEMARFTPAFADDAVFVWSNGTSAVGKAGLERFFAQDFADPAFDRYVRTPGRVSVAANGVRAVEHGTWTALKHNADGETRYGGDYAAHWMKTPEGWRIKGELYVKLRCEGSLCTP